MHNIACCACQVYHGDVLRNEREKVRMGGLHCGLEDVDMAGIASLSRDYEGPWDWMNALVHTWLFPTSKCLKRLKN